MPRLLSTYYLNLGGVKLAKTIRSLPEIPAGEFSCAYNIYQHNANQEEIDRSILDLSKALSYDPNNVYISLLLGRAYCMGNEYDKAVQSLRSFIESHPNNPLGYLELGFAMNATCNYEQDNKLSAGKSDKPISRCTLDTINKSYNKTLARLGINSDQIYSAADHAFVSADYTQANKWYSIASILDPHDEKSSISPEAFKWSISAAFSGNSLPNQFRKIIQIHYLNKEVLIQAEEMRWLRSIPEWDIDYGTLVASYPRDDDRISIMNWGGKIGAFLNVDRSDEYLVSVRMQNMPPAPIKILIEDNFIPLHQVETSLEDQSLQEFNFPAILNSGLHLITINFLNNNNERGIDRDAYVDWIHIQEMTDN